MRISTPYQFQSYTSSISGAQQRYLEIQQQISSGKRIRTLSDDPVGASRVVSLNSLKAAADRYMKNLDYGESVLKFTEDALGETHDLMRQAYELAVRGANGATDQTAREGMIKEVTELQRRLIELGNTQGPNGKYIFSGQLIETKPFTYALGVPTYNGDNNAMVVEHGPGDVLPVSIDAEDLYLDAYNALESLKTNLQGGNTGAISGVDIAALQGMQKSFNQVRGEVGARLAAIDQLQSDYVRRIDEYSATASGIEDVDMAEAIVNFQQAQAAYQAALTVSSKGFELSLMDFIR